MDTINTSPPGRTTRYEKYALGSVAGRDTLTRSKDHAHNKKLSSQKPQNQNIIFNPRITIPQKRKFDQYMNGATNLGLINREKFSNKNTKNQREVQSSSLSFSSLLNEKWISLQGMQGHAFRALNDREEYCNICWQDYSYLSDSYYEFIKRPMKQGSLKNLPKDLVTRGYSIESSLTSIKEKPTMEAFKAVKLLVNEDFDDLSENSHSFSLEKEDMQLNQPDKEFLSSMQNQIQRPVIPIGPRFQAEVPKWDGTTNTRHHYTHDDSKWLGIQLWPIPNAKETNTKGIGKGRPSSCSCDFSGSVNCVKQHISEARKILQLEIGTTFSSWMFDEMGEDVSKLWTLDDQKIFESLVKLNLLSNDIDFWKLAKEQFPSKSMKCMVSYYFNVYIPRRLSMETRSSSGEDQNDSSSQV